MSAVHGFEGGPRVLVIASGNAGKLREFTALLSGLNLELLPQPAGLEVEETGDSFAANARLKAEAVARATGHWALADDSGLSVGALGGAPGLHSARYAASDSERIARLLRELDAAGSPETPADRRAQFTAALALADPSGQTVLEVEGICPGRSSRRPEAWAASATTRSSGFPRRPRPSPRWTRSSNGAWATAAGPSKRSCPGCGPSWTDRRWAEPLSRGAPRRRAGQARGHGAAVAVAHGVVAGERISTPAAANWSWIAPSRSERLRR